MRNGKLKTTVVSSGRERTAISFIKAEGHDKKTLATLKEECAAAMHIRSLLSRDRAVPLICSKYQCSKAEALLIKGVRGNRPILQIMLKNEACERQEIQAMFFRKKKGSRNRNKLPRSL